MTRMRARLSAAPALLALMQLASPAPVAAMVMLVPICGEFGGHAVPIRLPGKSDGTPGNATCKICHIAMRKRAGADSCCDGEDNADGA